MIAIGRATGGRISLAAISNATAGRLVINEVSGGNAGRGKQKYKLILSTQLKIDERDMNEILTIIAASGILDE